MSGPGVVQVQVGDVIVQTRAGKTYVLRVDGGLPLFIGDDCVRREPVYTFRTPRARGSMLLDMVTPADGIDVSWVVPPEWRPLHDVTNAFGALRGAA